MDLLQQNIKKMNIPAELPTGHQLRFESKLQSQLHSHRKSPTIYLLYAIAASILLLICLNIFIFSDFNSSPELILVQENAEIIETEQYLQNEILQRLAVIEDLKIEPEKSGNFKNDIKEIDESLDKLKDDLEQAPGDQRIVDAILNTYILKIETLDNIMNILQKYS